MNRKTLGIVFAVLVCFTVGLVPYTEKSTVYGQCASASFGAYGDCSSSQQGGFSYAPMYRSAPMYQAPMYNSAGQCLNCGRFHGVQGDPLVNVQPPRIQFGIVNFAKAPRPVALPAKRIEYVETPRKATTRIKWGKLKFKVNSYTGICSLN